MVVEAVMPQASLGGRYQLGELLGRGGMADVHQATDEILLRKVAAKIYRPGAGTDEGRRRFQFEVELAASLDHPHLVRLFDAGVDAGRPWCVMQLINGGTLRGQPMPLPPHRVYAIGADIAWALEYLHSYGVVHRDVKPSNVLLGDRGEAYLSDFGVAVLQGRVDESLRGDLMGTPAYLSPEQVRGQPAGPPSDVYSFGLLLLESLTGRREYHGEPLAAALARLQRAPHIPAGVDPALAQLIHQMTALDAADRPTAAEVARRLLGPHDPAMPADVERVGRGQLRPVLISVGAAALLTAGAILGWGPAFSGIPPQFPAGVLDGRTVPYLPGVQPVGGDAVAGSDGDVGDVGDVGDAPAVDGRAATGPTSSAPAVSASAAGQSPSRDSGDDKDDKDAKDDDKPDRDVD